MGLNMTTAVNLFAKSVVHQRKIPFEITAQEIVPETQKEIETRILHALDAEKRKDFVHTMTMGDLEKMVQ
jgi:addiction module RelB/DinJ family antitoxin